MAYIGKRPVDTFPATNAVTSTLIAENNITAREIATNTIVTSLIADNAVTAVKIAENVISSRELAANTVATGNIADNAVDGTKIAQNSILTRHIDDLQVTTDQLGADAVTAAKLADDAVVTANIVDNAVTAAKLNISGNGISGQAVLSDGDGSFSYGAGGKTTEEVQDIAGAMFTSNTETGITATYQDGDGTIDLVVGTLNQDTTGNAATATALENARTIHGVSFDGTANIDLSEVVQDTAGAMFSSNTETNVTATYQDSDGTVDLAVEQQLNNTSAPYYHKIVVTVVNSGGNKYTLDGGTQAVAKLTPNVVYRFDQSDSSNSSHPLRIGTATNGSEITAGYTIYNKVGTPGSAGAYTEVALEQDAPGQLYYWCSAHSGMGASVSVADESFLTQTLTNKTLTTPAIATITAPADFTVDAVGDIILDADGGDFRFKDAGIQQFLIDLDTSPNSVILRTNTADGDMILQGNDGGTNFTALTLDMSDAGTAIFNHDITLPDNGKAIFGAGSDLQIYHDGTQSIITDAGTGQLKILAENTLHIGSATGTETYIRALKNGVVELYYDDAVKLATASDGIDVTGHIDAATLTTTGNIVVGGNLTVSGTTTSVESTTLEVADLNITVGKNATSSSATNGAGLTFGAWSSGTIPTFTWDHSNTRFAANYAIAANLVGNVTGNLTGTASAIADNSVTSAKIVNGTIVAADIANNAILTQHIDDNQITTDQIAANTIATGNIADNAIDGTKIAQNSILTKHIDDAQVTTDQLGADAVTAAKLADSAVVTANIVDGNITTAKIADNAITAAKLSIAGNGTSGQAILSDGDGTFSYGSSGKTTEEIQDIVGAMTTSNTETNITVTYQDSDGTLDFVVNAAQPDVTSLGTLTSLTVDDIKINGSQIGHTSDEDAIAIASNGVVTFSQIPVVPNDSIGADQLAANSVVSASIVNGSIVSADIAANTIATSNIADNAVDGSKIASNSILTRHIDDNQITGDQIADDIVLSGTGALRMPDGTTGQRPGSPAAGMFRYNTTEGKFEGYTDSWGEVGGGGSNGFLTDIFDGTTTPATDGSRVAFTMSQAVSDEKFVMVFIDGVYQAHNAYSVSGSTLTMADAPVADRVLTVHSVSAAVQGDGLNVDNFTGDGSDVTFTLSLNPTHENNTQVYVDGVYQFKNTYAVSGTTLTFSAAPPNGAGIEVMTHTQTTINNAAGLAPGAISGLTEVTPVAGDKMMILDATDAALKKADVKDIMSTAVSITSAADAVAMTFDSSENATFSGDINLADSKKAIFGAGSDLQIYHDGTHSRIKDAGTGHLTINATDFIVNNSADSHNMLQAIDGGAVKLFHAGSTKLETTSTGIDVTGTVTNDGLTVDGTAKSYTWRAIGNSASSGHRWVKIARISGVQSTRVSIDLVGRAGYGDGDKPSYARVIGQLNNDNNFDFSVQTTGTAFGEIGQVDVSTSETDIYVKITSFAELSAHAVISSGTVTPTTGNTGASQGVGSEPTGYVAFTENTILIEDSSGNVDINNASFPDNGKSIFGAGDDLQIYHDGSHSRILDNGSGKLQFGSDTGVEILTGNFATQIALFDTSQILLKENTSITGTLSVTGEIAATTSARIAQVAITSSSNAVAWDATAAANAYHVTTENTTFSAPSNAVEGAIIQVEIAQGGTARTIAWNTVFEFAASTAPTVTATANKTDIFTFRYNGSVWQEIGRVQNMAQT